MSEKYNPRPYQTEMIERITTDEAVALMLDMGLGKTSIVLTALKRLLDGGEIERPLIIAPKKVAESTWTGECRKWEHLEGFKISKVLGSLKDRKAALTKKADAYIVNRENVPWLVTLFGRNWPFDMVVIDESSSFKSPRAKRFKALKLVRPLIKRIVELTGTPAPNGLMDLWSQLYLLDRGERLEKSFTAFQRKYFTPGYGQGYVVYRWNPKPNAEGMIYSRISDICVSMKSEDYIDLPDAVYNEIPVKLPESALRTYRKLEKQWVLELPDEEVTAANAAALGMKLSQLANGFIYLEDKKSLSIHNEKVEALKEIVEANEGKPLLVFYWFKADRDRLLESFKDARELETERDIEDWNAGRIKILLAHPASAGHGLNLQYGGNIVVWYSLTWSLEYYQQANKRLHRPGQKETVIIHHLVAGGTVDEDILKAVGRKEKGQTALLEAVNERMRNYRSG